MKWKKMGIVFCPDGKYAWAKTHAMIPTPIMMPSGVLRIYCTMCDEHMVGRAGYVDLNPRNPLEILDVSAEPVLDVGIPGTFDENGVSPCSVVTVGNKLFMYYVGFELGTKIRYRLLTGLAISEDGGNSFTKVSSTPILERSSAELYFRCGPFAMHNDRTMRLWYIAGSSWTELNGKAMPVYSLKYLESSDGIHWPNRGVPSLEINEEVEHGFGRPWVIQRDKNDYQLFFSVRNRAVGAYRLGYAESRNGIEWVRKDSDMGLDVTPNGFDSDAIMYSAIIYVGGKTYCFFNGNEFGRHGFAVAELIT